MTENKTSDYSRYINDLFRRFYALVSGGDLSDEYQNYISDAVFKYLSVAGNTVVKHDIPLSQSYLCIRIVGDYVLNTSLLLLLNNIPQNDIDDILKKISAVVYKSAEYALMKYDNTNKAYELVFNNSNKIFVEEIRNLNISDTAKDTILSIPLNKAYIHYRADRRKKTVQNIEKKLASTKTVQFEDPDQLKPKVQNNTEVQSAVTQEAEPSSEFSRELQQQQQSNRQNDVQRVLNEEQPRNEEKSFPDKTSLQEKHSIAANTEHEDENEAEEEPDTEYQEPSYTETKNEYEYKQPKYRDISIYIQRAEKVLKTTKFTKEGQNFVIETLKTGLSRFRDLAGSELSSEDFVYCSLFAAEILFQKSVNSLIIGIADKIVSHRISFTVSEYIFSFITDEGEILHDNIIERLMNNFMFLSDLFETVNDGYNRYLYKNFNNIFDFNIGKNKAKQLFNELPFVCFYEEIYNPFNLNTDNTAEYEFAVKLCEKQAEKALASFKSFGIKEQNLLKLMNYMQTALDTICYCVRYNKFTVNMRYTAKITDIAADILLYRILILYRNKFFNHEFSKYVIIKTAKSVFEDLLLAVKLKYDMEQYFAIARSAERKSINDLKKLLQKYVQSGIISKFEYNKLVRPTYIFGKSKRTPIIILSSLLYLLFAALAVTICIYCSVNILTPEVSPKKELVTKLFMFGLIIFTLFIPFYAGKRLKNVE